MPHRPGGATWGFSRNSVSDQAAAALREALRVGELPDPLPGEHQLARDLGTSRPSVRAALAQLATEGLPAIAKGRRSRILNRQNTRSRLSRPRTCVVCPVSGMHLLMEHPALLGRHA